MENCKIIAVGDCVCDKFLNRNKMYPGGQCVNTVVFAAMNGIEGAFIGKMGDDKVAQCLKEAMTQFKIDYSHCRYYEGETGFALVTVAEDGDRIFLGSNKGGVAKEHAFDFTEEDLDYIKGFNVIYCDLNGYTDSDLPQLSSLGVPLAFDYSTRWNDEYLKETGKYITACIMSCAHLDKETREAEMQKAAAAGIQIVLGTCGMDGSYALYDGEYHFAPAKPAEVISDTMGAGDSYFSCFLCELLKSSKEGKLVEGTKEEMAVRLTAAMEKAAAFSSDVVAFEGAFGGGVPIEGRTSI